MKRRAILAAALAALPACTGGTVISGSDTVRSHVRHSVPAAGLRSLRVNNVAGSVHVIASAGGTITIDAVKHAGDTASLDRTHVLIDRSGTQLYVHTHYVKTGGWFARSGGAGVDYTIHVPANLDVQAQNVSGPIDVLGTNGDVSVSEVSGTVHIRAGRLQAARHISATSVSGDMRLDIAKNSDARVQAKTVSGAVHAFFPADVHKGIVGQSMDSRIGSGGASVDLHTVSGDITIDS